MAVCHKSLSGPTQFGEIYEVAVRVVTESLVRYGKDSELTFHLSPGTPAMTAVWIILAKTRFPGELIESSLKHGVRTASVPFDMSAEFIPDLLRGSDERLEKLAAGLPPEAPEFADIIHRSRAMARVIAKARRVAPRSVPILLEGESGTGKELLARSIYRASPRRDQPFKAVNCGAIPAELVESELFGHERGAFTGADKRKAGLCIVKTAPPTKSRTYAPLEFRAEDGETPPLCSTLLSSSSHLASVPFGRCVGAAPTWCWRTSLCGSK